MAFVRAVTDERDGEKKPRMITIFTAALKKACLAAGCPRGIRHDMPQTAVRAVVRSGIPERAAMQMAGHKTHSVFERYDIVSAGRLRDASRRLDAAPAAVADR